MRKLNNSQLVKPITKVIKCEQCQCGKKFERPHWTLIFVCSDCNNSHVKNNRANSEKQNNHE